jgi:transketolase C-terminal domain/subunit
MGIMDRFGTSAQKYDELLVEYNLTPADIAATAKKALA